MRVGCVWLKLSDGVPSLFHLADERLLVFLVGEKTHKKVFLCISLNITFLQKYIFLLTI